MPMVSFPRSYDRAGQGFLAREERQSLESVKAGRGHDLISVIAKSGPLDTDDSQLRVNNKLVIRPFPMEGR
jgi:hypothetical protein